MFYLMGAAKTLNLHIIYIYMAVALLVTADNLVVAIGRLLGCGSLVKSLEVDHDDGAVDAHDIGSGRTLDSTDEFAAGERCFAHACLEQRVIYLAGGEGLFGGCTAGDVTHHATGEASTCALGVLDGAAADITSRSGDVTAGSDVAH